MTVLKKRRSLRSSAGRGPARRSTAVAGAVTLVSGLCALVGSTTAAAGAHATPDSPSSEPIESFASVTEALGVSEYLGTSTPAPSAARGNTSPHESSQASATTLQDVSYEAFWARSEQLDRAAIALGLDDSSDYPDGFTGAVANREELALHVWWVGGKIPAETVERVALAAPTVRLIPHAADRSRVDLLNAITDLAASPTSEGVDLVYPREDGTGLVVTASDTRPIDRAAIAESTDVPVAFAPSERADTATVRYNDGAPLKGGAFYRATNTYDNQTCSVAFGMVRGSAPFLLTARHCVAGDDPSNNPVAYTTFRTSTDALRATGPVLSWAEGDVSLLRPEQSVTGWIYTGAWNSSSNTARKVTQVAPSTYTGMTVASSGGTTGENIGTVIGSGTRVSCRGEASNDCILPRVESNDGGVMVGGGDSGGAVYQGLSNGTARAAGVIKGAEFGPGSTRACGTNGGTQIYGTSPKCSRVMFYVPINAVEDRLDAHVMHGDVTMAP